MSRTGKARAAHPLRENLEVAVFAVVMAMGLKVFAVEAYQIPTGSMQPTLMGTHLLDPVTRAQDGALHDRVLVDKISFLFRDPERWEVIVFRYPLLTHANYVKRLVGMPGEELMIEHGDLYARPLGGDEDFRVLRKPWKVQRGLWKRVLPPPNTDPGAWTGWNESGALERTPAGTLLTRGPAEVSHEHRIKDDPSHGYPDAIVYRVPTMNAQARNVVSDLRWEFALAARGAEGPLRAVFEFGAELVALEVQPDGSFSLSPASGEPLAGRAAPDADGFVEFDVAFWDHTLRCEARGAGSPVLLGAELELEPRPAPRNAARFSTSAAGWELGPVRAWRDIHYLPPRQTSAAAVFDVEPGHYFMMGDNTQSSLDSRDWQSMTMRFASPVDGLQELRGDYMTSGPEPMYNNPRHSRDGSVMTFRDQHGGLHVLGMEDVRRASSDLLESAPLVPREYVLGRALAVFLPLRPFGPVNRFGLVR